MAKARTYKLAYDLFITPELVWLATDANGSRYLTDRHVVVSASLGILGLRDLVADLPDGVYSLFATKPPVRDLTWGASPKAAELAASEYGAASRPDRGWQSITDTDWVIRKDGRDQRLFVRADGSPVLVAERFAAAMRSLLELPAVADVRLDQAADPRPGRIRVTLATEVGPRRDEHVIGVYCGIRLPEDERLRTTCEQVAAAYAA